MARARGFMVLQGSMGETTFRKDGLKNIAHDKIDINERRRATGDEFRITRLHAKVFGIASRAANLIRKPISNQLDKAKDPKVVTRMNAEMMKVLNKNGSSSVVANVLNPADMDILLGFNFNEKVNLRRTFNVAYDTNFDRVSGMISVMISPFVPSSAIRAPKYATHFVITTIAIEVDFTQKESKAVVARSMTIPLNSTMTVPITLEHQLTPGNTQTLFIVLGIDFIEENGFYYSTKEEKRKVNTLAIVDLSF